MTIAGGEHASHGVIFSMTLDGRRTSHGVSDSDLTLIER
jgi:hypothetical protein